MDKLDDLKGPVGKELKIRGLTANFVASWVVQYVLGLEREAIMRAIRAGKACEEGKVPEPVGDPSDGGKKSSPTFRGDGEKIVTPKLVPNTIDSRPGRRRKRNDARTASTH